MHRGPEMVMVTIIATTTMNMAIAIMKKQQIMTIITTTVVHLNHHVLQSMPIGRISSATATVPMVFWRSTLRLWTTRMILPSWSNAWPGALRCCFFFGSELR